MLANVPQIISITCDNASANTAMLDELITRLPNFKGTKAHVRCFSHTVNLTAKGVLRPFEPAKPVAGDGSQPPVSPEDIGLDELYTELRDIEENGNQGADNVDGFVEVLQEMTEAEREQWKEDVEPVRTALFKVSPTLQPHHSALSCLSVYPFILPCHVYCLSFEFDNTLMSACLPRICLSFDNTFVSLSPADYHLQQLLFLLGPQTRKISFKIINSTTLLLPRWRQHVSGTRFKDRVLPRDVATRWNSTYDMLAAFIEMKNEVSQFLDRSSNGLAEFLLTDDEWEAIAGLVSALKVRLSLVHF